MHEPYSWLVLVFIYYLLTVGNISFRSQTILKTLKVDSQVSERCPIEDIFGSDKLNCYNY